MVAKVEDILVEGMLAEDKSVRDIWDMVEELRRACLTSGFVFQAQVLLFATQAL